MAPVTLDEVLGATYTNQDVAFALQHGNFGDFKRNLQRGDEPKDRLVVLPRNTGSAGVGGDFRYAHVLEYLIHMLIGPVHSREVAKAVVLDLLRRLMHNDTGLAKLNAMSEEDRRSVWDGSTFEREEDPWRLSDFVDFPRLFLNSDFISRDLSDRTYLLFDSHRIVHVGHSLVMTTGATGLAEAHAHLIDLVTSGAADEETRRLFEDGVRVPGVFDLTGALDRVDQRLGRRLNARRL